MVNATLRRKPNAENPRVRFDEGEVASAKPRRGILLHKAKGKEFENLKSCVNCAIEKIYTSERYLIDNGLSEWTIAAQFHYWMRRFASAKFRGYDFDSEYNHMHLISDRDQAVKIVGINGALRRVRPDFIIHKRGDPLRNFLWVELKRHGGTAWNEDLMRVRSVTQEVRKEECVKYITGYKYGLGIKFLKRSISCEWYKNNQQLCSMAAVRTKRGLTWRGDCDAKGRSNI